MQTDLMTSINRIKEKALKENVPIICDEGLNFIIELIRTNQIKSVLEIGSAVGYSALTFSIKTNCRVVSIERDANRYQEALLNQDLLGVSSKKVQFILDDALEFNCDLLNEKFDMIFIDAAKSQYEKFFNKYTPYLKNSGIVVTDNLYFHHLKIENVKNRHTRMLLKKIKKFREFLDSNPIYETKTYDIGDGISVSKRRKNENCCYL